MGMLEPMIQKLMQFNILSWSIVKPVIRSMLATLAALIMVILTALMATLVALTPQRLSFPSLASVRQSIPSHQTYLELTLEQQ